MSKIRIFIYISILLIFTTPFWAAQYPYSKNEAIFLTPNDSIKPTRIDSLRNKADSMLSDSTKLPLDSIAIPKKKGALEAIVDYQASDSIVLTAGNWGYLYGDANIDYQDINLKAEQISMSMDSSIVTATFGLDSIGEKFGYPIFKQGDTDYESETVRYNFKSQKGYTFGTRTEQGEGFVVAGQAKRNPDESFFMTDGQYTTCDQHDHPHFYIKLTKAKVQPKKNVVTGPAYLVIEDLPIPFIGLPFGFFPFTDKYSSGVLMPSFGDDMDKGFFLHNGGYYFAINDNVDVSLIGEIYTKGSWGLSARSTYRKRYKYNASLDVGYMITKLGDKGVDYSESKDFRVNWTHSQDPKADMFRTVSASVNFATSKFDRNALSSLGTMRATEGTKNSTVSVTQRIPNSPWTLSASTNIAQTTRDSSISLTLPNLTATMSRIYPFKKKEASGDEQWFEKIHMSYTGDLRNSIHTQEDKLFESNIQEDWKNGIKHTIPIGATFSLFDHLNISPAINYNERWYTSKIEMGHDLNSKSEKISPIDTAYSFYRVYDFNFNVSLQTKMYGMYKPLIGGDKIKAIRHVFTPSATFSYNPNFEDSKYGAYEQYEYYEANGEKKTEYYSPYQYNIFGTAPRGKNSSVSFAFENNIEMKVKSESDSLGEKKISLIDNFGVNFGYNFAADSMKLSDINTNIRLRLSKSLTVNLSGTFDPYVYKPIYDEYGEVKNLYRSKDLRIQNGKGIGRLMRTGYSISPSINQDTFKKWFGGGKDDDKSKDKNRQGSPADTEGEGEEDVNKPRQSMFAKTKEEAEYDADGYEKNDVKWDMSFNYSMSYGYDMSRIDVKNLEFKRKLTHNLSMSGSIQPTKHWRFNFSGTYDFDTNKIAYSTFSLTRDLHCWSISANFTPMGPSKFFYVKISASSQLLQDLKWEERKRSSSYDPEWD